MRRFGQHEEFSALVTEALGARFRPVGFERLRGGSKKGVYRVHVDGPEQGPTSVVVYSWADSENFWPGADAEGDTAHPFVPAPGMGSFLAAQRRLGGVGVRVPEVLLADDGRERHAADVAVVEDVAGGTLESLFDSDPARAASVLGELAEMLAVMHGQRGPRAGGPTCEQLVVERALVDLTEAAGRDTRIAASADALRERLLALADRVTPRSEHGLVHGELGPDHVLVDAAGHPVLIDIEGLMVFDVEWEHVFLQIRFHERYAALSRPGLDRARLDLYMLAMRLSLVAGPLRLLDGDFPDRAFMRGIAEHNLACALALLDQALA